MFMADTRYLPTDVVQGDSYVCDYAGCESRLQHHHVSALQGSVQSQYAANALHAFMSENEGLRER